MAEQRSFKYSVNAHLVSREDITDEIALFRFQLLNGTIPDFDAGQYAEIALPPADYDERSAAGERVRVQRRPYSIASAPNEAEAIELLIVKVDGGEVTPKLFELRAGDKVWMNPRAKGHFTLDSVTGGIAGKTLVMVSTGTGIAPFMSMLREHREDMPWKMFVMINGVRYPRDLAYWDELEDLAKEEPKFRYIPCASREAWGGVNGRVSKVFEEGIYEREVGSPLQSEDTHLFLCGNPAMIDDLTQRFTEQGFHEHHPKDPGNLHFERYW